MPGTARLLNTQVQGRKMLGRKMKPIIFHFLPLIFLPNLLTTLEMKRTTGSAQLLLSHTWRNIRKDTPRHQPCKHDEREPSRGRSPSEKANWCLASLGY